MTEQGGRSLGMGLLSLLLSFTSSFLPAILFIVITIQFRSVRAVTCIGNESNPLWNDENDSDGGGIAKDDFVFTSLHASVHGTGLMINNDDAPSESSDNMSETTRCQWEIHPQIQQQTTNDHDHISYIEVYFEELSLSGGWLEIVEITSSTTLPSSSESKRTIAFYQTSVRNIPTTIRTATVPPSLQQQTNVQIIWYGLGRGRSSLSFRLTYTAIVQKRPIKAFVKLVPAWARIVSPDVDGKIAVGSNYSYLIEPDVIEEGNSSLSPPSIRVMITKLHLPNDPYDKLTVYDGETIHHPILAILTGTKLPYQWIIPTQKKVLVVLTTMKFTAINDEMVMTTEGQFQIDYLADGDSNVCGNGVIGDSQPSIDSSLDVRYMTGLTGVFTDGTASTSDMRQLSNCQWIIRPYLTPHPPNLHSVVLYFNRLSIPLSSDLLVYEGENLDGADEFDEDKLLWYCRGCEDIYPPILSSKSGVLQVILRSREASANPGWTGFEAEYYTTQRDDGSHEKDDGGSSGVIGPGDGTIHLKMASQLSILPPFILNGDSSSTLLPQLGMDVVWYIEPNNLPDSGTIALTFNSLNLSSRYDGTFEYDNKCLSNLTIYDGTDMGLSPVLSTYCFGSSSTSLELPPWDWIVSSGPTLAVRLSTAAWGNGTLLKHRPPPISFDFTYYSNSDRYQCGYQHSRKPGVYRAPSMMLTDGRGQWDAFGSGDGKGKVNMETGLDCAWLIEPNVPGVESVSLIFEAMDISGGEMVIYDGSEDTSEILYECRDCSLAPEKITSQGGSMYITFKTDNTILSDIGMGFHARYYADSSLYSRAMGNGAERWGCAVGTYFGPPEHRYASPSSSSSYLMVIDSDPTKISTNKNQTSQNKIIIAFLSINVGMLDCSTDRLVVYDGDDVIAPRIVQLCGTNEPQDWIISSGPQLTFELVSASRTKNNGIDFDAQFVSDIFSRVGWSPSCGLTHVPATFRSPSMVLSDGSGTTRDKLFPNQYCSWLIKPDVSDGDTIVEIQIVFDSILLVGGGVSNAKLALFDRADYISDGIVFDFNDLASSIHNNPQSTDLLWFCDGCSYMPRSLLATSQSMLVMFETGDASSTASGGGGFKALYRTIVATNTSLKDTTAPTHAKRTLNQVFMSMPFNLHNPEQYAWKIPFFDDSGAGEMSFGDIIEHPCYTNQNGHTTASTERVLDGSQGGFERALEPLSESFCGVAAFDEQSADPLVVLEGERNLLVQRKHKPSSRNQAKCKYSNTFGMISSENEKNEEKKMPIFPFCQYLLDAGKVKGGDINLTLTDVRLMTSTSFSIYAGRSRKGEKLYFCGPDFAALIPKPGEKDNDKDGDAIMTLPPYDAFCNDTNSTMQFNSSCGALFIVLNTTTSSESDVDVDLMSSKPFFHLQYSWNKLDIQRNRYDLCIDDSNWEKMKDDNPRSTIDTMSLIAWITAALVIMILLLFCGYKTWGWMPVRRRDTATHHATFTPVLNTIQNKIMTKNGECAICFGSEKILRLNDCRHQVCVGCLRKYVKTALGDASLLPLKCMMHSSGCDTIVEVKFIQRVLKRKEFERYNLFNDRALFGDGMPCIFCSKYVVFPSNTEGGTLVSCPYCYKRFCMKCQMPWHVGGDCQSTRINEELEEWRKKCGATRCPGCNKIIEKNDPETCNHMVHKSTDSIPCTRERTDFCYCCGVEVTRNHPHCAIDHPGVNHFPDGVFNDCLTILARSTRRRRPFTSPPSQRVNWPGTPPRVAPIFEDEYMD